MSNFLATQPTDENYWRGIVLLGRNVATYKLALAKSLLELGSAGKTFITLDELAIPYTRHLTDHLRHSDKQINARSSSFLDVCRRFNTGDATETELIQSAVSMGFNNVIDAFHVVNRGLVPTQFYVDERKSRNGITITDSLLELVRTTQGANFPREVEARWRLVETAWALDVPPSLLAVQYDADDQSLFVQTPRKRIGLTGSRDALNGYQKGRCFYCFRDLILEGEKANVDVDHVFPLTLHQFAEFSSVNLNGVWNLVLACTDCNRRKGGKFARVPSLRYVERLHTRNQFYIESAHPLRETLINQTGLTEPLRRSYLNQMNMQAVARLLHTWESVHEQQPLY